MNKTKAVIITILLITFIPLTGYAKEPPNIGLLKLALIRYHDSGKYEHDINQVMVKARAYLKKRVTANNCHNLKKKLAIIFDLDETLISNYDSMIADDFSARKDLLDARLAQVDEPPIPECLILFNYAKANNVTIFIITGRKENLRKESIKELHNAGFEGWKKLYLRGKGDDAKTAVEFKSAIRKEISAQGYDIVLNIGDQYSDLAGGYADYQGKLPNPFYYVD